MHHSGNLCFHPKRLTMLKIFTNIKCFSYQYNADTYSGNHFHPILMFSGMVEWYSQSNASLWKSLVLSKKLTMVKIFTTIKCCNYQHNADPYSGNHFHPILMFLGMVEGYLQSNGSLWKSPILPTKVRLG